MELHVTVIYSPAPRVVQEWLAVVRQGSTVAQALAASGLAVAHPGLDLGAVEVGIWGCRVPTGHLVRNRDRVEIYRALRVDPKVARRERFREQGVRAAGLFATGKAGGRAAG